MTILITGANGQLGLEIQKLLREKNLPFIPTDRNTLDITDNQCVVDYFVLKEPTVVFHCAAYTAVDAAEDEGKQANYDINVTGTRNVAEVAEKVGATMFYISTDYVFDGAKKDDEYIVSDKTNPLNEYGKAKLDGEKEVEKVCTKYYIIRTSWVYGEFGKNFVFTMQRLAKQLEKLTVVNDQFGRPTWTRSLAEFMLYLHENNSEFGYYHFSNEGSCSWFEFAKEILKDEKIVIEPVDSTRFPQKARRPKYSVMDLSKSQQTGFKIDSWQVALKKMLEEKK